MKLFGCFIAFVILSVVNSYPINMFCIPSCNVNITASEKFVKEWLNPSNDMGIHQLRNSMDSLISMLMRSASTVINDCEETYNSHVSVPDSTNVTTDTVRGFFNAYLLHKYFIDYIVSLNTTKLVHKDWVYQTTANIFYNELLKMQNVLNFNIERLNLLLNTTCYGCISNSTKSAADKATLIRAMEECASPIFEVLNTIADHSEKLFMMINGWQVSTNESGSGGFIISTMIDTNSSINDLYLCNIPLENTI